MGMKEIDKELLYRFFNGEATFAEETKVKDWLEGSAENRKEYLRERRLFDLTILSDDKLYDAKKLLYSRKKSYYMECLRIVATIVITLIISSLYFATPDEEDEIAMQTVTVPYGQRVNLLLSDGTNVWLNSGTKMSYPQIFAKKRRDIYLDGEAYFEVSHNKEKPFLVHTNQFDIEVLGTKFNVDSYSRDDAFESSLMEGVVKVTRKEDRSSLTLSPSYKVVLRDEKMVVEKIEDYNTYRWREGLICFKNKYFLDLLVEFEKYYDIRIIVESPKLANPILTGKFRVSDGVEYALKVLQKDVKFRYKRHADSNIIYIR
ncbi:MAG: anti-sigma factor [Bacteroidetes bacterium]|jgi:transmembrane sensor|nr:anti-sigma factor [Bacteroidota bacterium]